MAREDGSRMVARAREQGVGFARGQRLSGAGITSGRRDHAAGTSRHAAQDGKAECAGASAEGKATLLHDLPLCRRDRTRRSLSVARPPGCIEDSEGKALPIDSVLRAVGAARRHRPVRSCVANAARNRRVALLLCPNQQAAGSALGGVIVPHSRQAVAVAQDQRCRVAGVPESSGSQQTNVGKNTILFAIHDAGFKGLRCRMDFAILPRRRSMRRGGRPM